MSEVASLLDCPSLPSWFHHTVPRLFRHIGPSSQDGRDRLQKVKGSIEPTWFYHVLWQGRMRQKSSLVNPLSDTGECDCELHLLCKRPIQFCLCNTLKRKEKSNMIPPKRVQISVMWCWLVSLILAVGRLSRRMVSSRLAWIT